MEFYQFRRIARSGDRRRPGRRSVRLVYWPGDDPRGALRGERAPDRLRGAGLESAEPREIEINDYANSWYFNVPDSNCKYSVELIRKFNNRPIQIKSSNELEVPNNHILFERNRREIFFKNVKTNEVISKNVANLQFIKHIGIAMPLTINEFYNKFYDEKDIYDMNNPSSNSY